MFDYNQFIFGKLILESVLFYSDDFRKILKSIDSPVSGALLNIESEDLELKNNFIDLGETNKLISYIQDDRVSDVENPFIEKRQSIKVGRGIKSILNSTGLNFSDSEVEDFVNKYKAEFDKLNEGFSKFELVKGEDIRKWYLEENYDSIKSTLGSSCMRYGRCKTYFDIYVENESVCSLLILKNDKGDKIKARALVWVLSDGRSLIDRVYYNEQSDVELYKKYAAKNGFWIKDGPKIRNHQTGEYDYLTNISVSLDDGDFSEYPYLDTFKFLINGDLYTDHESGDGAKLLEDTYGGWLDECSYCYGDITSDCHGCDGSGEVECEECYGGEVECGECYGNGEVECSECYGGGQLECGECDGDGQLECGECDGDGEIECDECGGSGEGYDGEECDECGGSGQLECGECDGSGEVECGECYGNGEVECDECDGSGQLECDECNDGFV